MALGSEPAYAAPPMAAADPAPSLTRHALIPISVVLCFALVYVWRVEIWWIAAVGLPAIALYLAAPRLGRASMARFDRDALRLLAADREGELPARYARAVWMRLFAPPAAVAARRGLVAAETGEAYRARAAYRDAIAAYPEDRAPVAARLGYAHACYQSGDDAEAIRAYREILKRDGTFPSLERRLAASLAREGVDLDDAERLADAAHEQSPDDEAKLVRALVLAARGRRGPARKLLKQARDAEELEALREEVETMLEEI